MAKHVLETDMAPSFEKLSSGSPGSSSSRAVSSNRSAGYQDSGADIAYTLKQKGVRVITRSSSPQVSVHEGWAFPDTEEGIYSAVQQGATHLWANTILFSSHPLQTMDKLAPLATDIYVVGQPPGLVENFDDKGYLNNKLREIGGYTLPSSWTVTLKNFNRVLQQIDTYPVVGKPVRGRGSHGVKVCHDPVQLRQHVEALFNESPFVMIEEFLAGQEATITVMPPTPARPQYWSMAPVVRFNHESGIAPYNATVAVTANSRVATGEEMNDHAYKNAMRQCEAVARLIGATAPIRVDVRRFKEDSGFALFDINMKPNMTGPSRPGREDQASLTAIAAAAMGWDYGTLLQNMLWGAQSLSAFRNDGPGLPVLAAADYDVEATGSLDHDKKDTLDMSQAADNVEEDSVVAPDQFDEKYQTTKKEIWAYYAYYIGNNGLSLFNFAPTAFQNLLSQAADSNGLLMFAGKMRSINSIVLLSNGISFAIQIVVFLIIGSFADFGQWRPNILIALSIIAWAIGFGWLGVHDPSKWEAATGLYIIGLIAYQTTLTFWTAAFPGLARNTAEMKHKAEELVAGTITRDDYDFADTMKRSQLSNVAFYVQSVGEIFILAIIVGIMFGVNVNESTANNNWGLSVLIAFVSGVWLLVAMPWFILEKRRPGQDPAPRNIILAGIWQLYNAATQILRLRQSFIYLIGYFLLGDSLNTTVTVIATLQNSIVAYNTLQLTYLLIVGIAAQAVGIYAFWFIQQRYNLGTKTMFNTIAVAIILLDGWGMIGIWTQRFGFHNEWEVWVYQAFYGLFVCPWYSYSQIMISEVTPRGKEFLFFSLFSIIGKTSSFIGPIVSSAIIDASPSGNNSMPFYFLFGLSLLSFGLLLFFVDLKKSRKEQEVFLEEEKRRLNK
ncbi:Autophagy-related protein 22-1 [Talaromyces islandicus]|uniref:Autophagy-related protein n=1 Tax=Talaromyces islandicus TaxID=28573 RepID=A0A0U1LTY4_TALIS|nr:Autophagy-related protein 22-1 [Talaromyces islandicus]